jgi:predicted phosphate transport protein (TIGR00153 family)
LGFWRKRKVVEQLVLSHLECVDQTLRLFRQSLDAYLKDRDVDRAAKLAFETHSAEGVADDVRRQVETELLSGALLPHNRREILEVIESVDRLANSAESVLDYLLFQKPEIPEDIRGELVGIVEETGCIFDDVKALITDLFGNTRRVHEHTQRIEHREGEVDKLERAAIKQLFKLDLDLAYKLQIHGFIERLVELSDRAEDLSDQVDIMAIERRL